MWIRSILSPEGIIFSSACSLSPPSCCYLSKSWACDIILSFISKLSLANLPVRRFENNVRNQERYLSFEILVAGLVSKTKEQGQ